MTQPKLMNQLFEEFKVPLSQITAKKANSPQRALAFQSTDDTPMDPGDYLHLLGSLIYLVKSRPDIATAVSFAATYSSQPTTGAFEELLLCLAYLYHTRDKGLRLLAGTRNRDLILTCYVDASYLTHRDSKSHSGYCMSFGQIGTFYSKSSKQTLVTTSSTHAEMRALGTLTIDIVYLINLCAELHRPISLPAIILEDNQPVIDLLKETGAKAKRCKHFLMIINWIREQITAGYISINKISTDQNLADVLTKIITGGEFTRKADLLLGHCSPLSL